MYRVLAVLTLSLPTAAQVEALRPNVILVMSDDQGWGDVGFRGHPKLQTPHLDAMAEEGIRFERFYAAAPVCSPTRGSCLTGRHPYRYGIRSANVGHMPAEERTLAEILKQHGYRTGHFGKWHLGTLTKEGRDSNRGGDRNHQHYAPPWQHGFEICFSTEAKVPTWDPMVTPAKWASGVGRKQEGAPYGTAYWNEKGDKVADNLEGDDSRVIMDRVLPFVRDSVERQTPFFAVVWFHAPHLPVVSDGEHLKHYEKIEDLRTRHYYACLSALDAQVGRLRKSLAELGVAKNTMLWFCSDNGPEGRSGKAPGSSGGLRGRKRHLYEGGVRVPGLLVWPARIQEPRVVRAPATTSDYLPTVLAALGIEHDASRLDGVNLMPILEGKQEQRGKPIAFWAGQRLALIGDRWKLIRPGRRKPFELYDLSEDRAEASDVEAQYRDRVQEMRAVLETWQQSVRAR